MSLFICLMLAIDRIERFQRNLLCKEWRKKKLHLVCWEVVCKPSDQGGLNIRLLCLESGHGGLAMAHRAWGRRLYSQNRIKQARWRTMLASWHDSRVWRGVMMKLQDNFQQQIISSWGKGDRIYFWMDIWRGHQPLLDCFPTVFAVAYNSKGHLFALITYVYGDMRNMYAWSHVCAHLPMV